MLNTHIEATFDGTTWTDITNDVLAPIYFSSGMTGNSVTDRVADVGRCTFQLNNSITNSAHLAGYYSPGHANCRQGFASGLIIRVRIVYQGIYNTKWYGRIAPDGISVDPNTYGPRRTSVIAYDWMYQATAHTLYLTEYTTNKRMDEIIPLVVANMPIAPLSTSYAVGQDTFPSVFDTVRYNTTAMAEFQKVALSELGYIYLNHNSTSDEILVSEDRLFRNNVTSSTLVPIESALLETLINENGEELVNEDGEALLISEVRNISLDNAMVGIEVTHGANLANRIEVITYPKKIDSAATTVLFTLQSRIKIEAGATISGYRVVYRDPTGGAQKVAGKDMVTPVANTDYWMDSVSGSDAKDLTANLAITVTYGTEGAEYSFTNNGASTGYIYLQARGKGIYIYDPVSKIYQDTTSINQHGTHSLSVDLKYQNDPRMAEVSGQLLLSHHANPRSTAKSATFYTSNEDLATVFNKIDVGSKITIKESQTGINGDYFVNGWEAEVVAGGRNETTGNLIQYRLFLKRSAEDTYFFAKWDTLGTWDSKYGWDL